MRVIHDRGPAFDVDAFLAAPLFAHLATTSPHGPRDSPVWFLWEDAAFWIIGNRLTDTFPGRVDADPRVALGIVDFDAAAGRVRHVGARGHGRVQAWDPARAERLLVRYLGRDVARWDVRFRDALHEEGAVFVRVTPETLVVRDQSYAPADA